MEFAKTIRIGTAEISTTSKTFIIAEAGVNHGGDMNLARKLVDEAFKAGVDAVKFQSFKSKNLILENVKKAPYQQRTTSASESQMDMLKKLEMSQAQQRDIKNYCEQKGILFLTTPYDTDSLDELDELDVAAYKIASTDLTNLPFLVEVAKKKKPIILSTGMSYLTEVLMALEAIKPFNGDVIVLQCTANYPIADDEANLRVINTLRKNFPGIVGFSDHTVGVGAGPFAVAMGATVIEKHFTLDKSLVGPDHEASLSPVELKQFVESVRKVETYLGISEKFPTLAEIGTRASLQRYFVAKSTIKQGTKFSLKNITAKRTGGSGISPIYTANVIGKTAKKTFKIDEVIEL